jgi:hypothetical protein
MQNSYCDHRTFDSVNQALAAKTALIYSCLHFNSSNNARNILNICQNIEIKVYYSLFIPKF